MRVRRRFSRALVRRAVEEVGGGKARLLHVAHHGGLDGSRRESGFCRIYVHLALCPRMCNQ